MNNLLFLCAGFYVKYCPYTPLHHHAGENYAIVSFKLSDKFLIVLPFVIVWLQINELL